MQSSYTKKQQKNRGGFTLIEMIVAVAVSVILLAIAVPAVGGFMVSSELTELNQNAKTIYLATQDYLSQAAASGRLEYINSGATKLSVTELNAIQPSLSDKELKDNKTNLAYLRISKNGQDDAALIEILAPFVNDPNVMEQSVLVEYNSNTGIVRSVFYSKKADTLAYSGEADARGNVLVREEAALREKRQGYYGVDYTGNMKNAAALGATNPVLTNAERLTLEWDDVTPSGAEWQRFLTYTVTIYSAEDNTEYLRLEGVPNPVGAAQPGAPFKYPETMTASENTMIELNTYWAGVAQTGGENRKHSISVRKSATAGQPQKLVLILDDIHRSIYEKYPAIAIGNLRATVEPTVDWAKVQPGKTKQDAHSYFASGEKDKGKDTYTYELQYARHLNNIRHAQPDSNYNFSPEKANGGSTTLDWTKPEGTVDASKTPVDFEVVNFQYRKAQPDGSIQEIEDIDGYRGTLTGTVNKAAIKGLTIVPTQSKHLAQHPVYDYTQNYGMFARLAKGAKIENITLSNLKLDTSVLSGNRTFQYVGALAGYAKDATVTNFRVENSTIIANTGNDTTKAAYTGGLIGYAENGTLNNVYSSSKVQAGAYVASSKSITGGRDYVGGLVGSAVKCTIKNSESVSTVLGGNYVGGIAGLNENGTLSNVKTTGKNCVVGLQNVGGIVGHNKGVITAAAFSYPAFNSDAKLQEVLVVLGRDGQEQFKANVQKFDINTFVGVLGTENVGGIVGLNDKSGGKLSGFNTKQMVKGQKHVGGIVGNNQGDVNATGTEKTAAGLVVCTEVYAGGVFGIHSNQNATLNGFVNEAHVVAGEYAGGILGSNGDDSAGQSGAKGTTITSCVNKGAVFAYKQYGGGIAGRNLGNINKCESVGGNVEALDKLLAAANVLYGNYVGGIAGYNDGQITNSKAGNLVKGHDFVGGITGHNDTAGYLYNCETTGGRIIASGNFAGGYIGLNTSSQLADDKAMGGLDNRATLVKGKYFVGGVIGCNLFTKGSLTMQATNGYQNKSSDAADQTVIEGEAYVGGIIGYNTMDITKLPNPDNPDEPGADSGSSAVPASTTTLLKCSNYGQVKTLRYGGGIIGLNSADSALRILQSTNAGIISYANYAGGAAQTDKSYYIAGITGRNTRTGVIEDCTNSGKILNQSKYTGGLVEVNEGLMLRCINAGQVQAAKSNYVGGIAGYNITAGPVVGGTDQQATIRECKAGDTSRISGVNYVGGIVGANVAILESCVLNGITDYDANEKFQVAGNDCVGGIAGFNQASGRLINCETQGGSVRGNNFVGGFTGFNSAPHGLSGTQAQYTINNARVFGQYFVGGITGAHIDSALEYCANGEYGRVIAAGGLSTGKVTLVLEERDATGKITATKKEYDIADTGAGGIVGGLRAGETLRNCYNAGVVVGGGARTGGITGQNKGTVENCENRGMVVGSTQAASLAATGTLNGVAKNANNVGGIVGHNNGGTIQNCKALPNTSKVGNRQSHVLGGQNVGGIVGNHAGGAVKEPQIKSLECAVTGVGAVGGLFGNWEIPGATLTLTDRNITATVKGNKGSVNGIYPVGGIFGRLTGTGELKDYIFDGVVSQEASWDLQHFGGIIGRLEQGQVVTGCTMKGKVSSQTTAGTNTSGTGGIVGYSDGTVKECTLAAKALVSGNSMLGGIIGYNGTQGTMLKCLNEKDSAVQGTLTTVGGYIGQNSNDTALVRTAATDVDGRLINYATVTGGTNVGGIVGLHSGNIEACDNKGEVRIISHYGGGVVGAFRNQSANAVAFTLNDCNNQGTVTVYSTNSTNSANHGTGGVVGYMDTTGGNTIIVENCHNAGTVEALLKTPNANVATSVRAVGGVVGRMNAGTTVKNCTNAINGKVAFSATVGRDVGGIAGIVHAGAVERCNNLGTVEMDMPQHSAQVQLPGGTNLGGIAGYVENGGSLTRCINDGTLTVSDAYRYYAIGGIAGMVTSPGATNTSLVDSCVNNKPITVKSGYFIGGVAGSLAGATVSNCTNKAPISARQQMGGIVGALYRAASGTMQDNVIENCTNDGEILQNESKFASGTNDTFIGIGGILGDNGANEARIEIKNCKNTAKISLEQGNVSGAGGIMGRVSFGDKTNIVVKILDSTNSGTITAIGTGLKTGVGGILGHVFLSPVQVERCANSGALLDGNSGYREVGGIVGNMEHKNARVSKCVNSGNIDATNENTSGQEIGGIVGRNGGVVSGSSNNLPLGGKIAAVRGRDSVGGIVGSNRGETSFVYSDETVQEGGATVTTINEMPIEAIAGVAGGIVGTNSSGGVVDTFNKGEVTASNVAGGVIGVATALSANNEKQTAGSLANSYNIAKVSGNGAAAVTGGIIGRRQEAYDSVGSHNIKQSYYLYTTDMPALAVGNEPDASRTVGEKDFPKEGVLIDRRLSGELFAANGMTEPDYKDIAALSSAIAALMEKQSYPLNQPRNVETVSNKGYEYTTSWEMVQGLVKNYKVFLRPVDAGENANKDILVGESSTELVDAQGRLNTYVNFNMKDLYADPEKAAKFKAIYGIEKFEDLIGKKFDIVVQTISSNTSTSTGPQNSTINTSEEKRKILPVLPTPAGTTYKIGAGRITTLTLDNTLYANGGTSKIDKSKYKNLEDNPIYNLEYVAGLGAFWYENQTADVQAYKGWFDTGINKEVLPYSFTIDHSKDVNNTQKTGREVRLQARSNDTVNSYAHSEYAPLSYILQVKLNAPTNLESTYVGDAQQAQYQLNWYGVENNKGYLVTVSYTDVNGALKTKKITTAKNITGCTWTVPPVQNGTAASFTVIALGDNGTNEATGSDVYLTSSPSNSQIIGLPYQLTAPTISAVQDAQKDTALAISWSTTDAESYVDGYTLAITRYAVSDPTKTEKPYVFVDGGSSVTVGSGVKTYTVNLADPTDFGYVYKLSVTANGIPTTSLTSAPGIFTFPLYVRRTTPSALKNTSEPTRPDRQEMTFTWDGKTSAGAQYPELEKSGSFELRFARLGDIATTATLKVDTYEELIKGVSYRFTEENGFVMGATYQVQLRALDVAGAYSRSEYSTALDLTLPKHLESVTNVVATPWTNPNPDSFALITQYGQAMHTISWDTYPADQSVLMATMGSYAVRGYITVNGKEEDITADLTFDPALSALVPTSTSVAVANSPKHAGKEVTFKVIAVAGSTALDSIPEPASPALTMPLAQLVAPVVDSITDNSATKTVTTLLKATTEEEKAVLQTIVDWQSNISQYIVKVTLDYNEPGSDGTTPKTLTMDMEEASFIDTEADPDSVKAKTSFAFTHQKLLDKANAGKPDGEKLTELPNGTWRAEVFLKAKDTTGTGFLSSDGTDSDGHNVYAALPEPLMSGAEQQMAPAAGVQAPSQPKPADGSSSQQQAASSEVTAASGGSSSIKAQSELGSASTADSAAVPQSADQGTHAVSNAA